MKKMNKLLTSTSLIFLLSLTSCNADPINHLNNLDYVIDTNSGVYLMKEFENNNSVNDANNIYVKNESTKKEYKATIEGTLQNNSSIKDADYFRFSLIDYKNVKIDIKSKNNLEGKVDLIIYDSLEKDNLKKKIRTDKTLSLKSSSHEELLSGGNYFLKLSSDEGSQIQYTINIEFTTPDTSVIKFDDYVNHYYNYGTTGEKSDIFKAKNNYKGLVWKNSYIPTNLMNNIISTDQIIYGDLEGYSFNDYALEELYRISKGKYVPLVRYYIWDATLLSFFANLMDLLTTKEFRDFRMSDRYVSVESTNFSLENEDLYLTINFTNKEFKKDSIKIKLKKLINKDVTFKEQIANYNKSLSDTIIRNLLKDKNDSYNDTIDSKFINNIYNCRDLIMDYLVSDKENGFTPDTYTSEIKLNHLKDKSLSKMFQIPVFYRVTEKGHKYIIDFDITEKALEKLTYPVKFETFPTSYNCLNNDFESDNSIEFTGSYEVIE